MHQLICFNVQLPCGKVVPIVVAKGWASGTVPLHPPSAVADQATWAGSCCWQSFWAGLDLWTRLDPAVVVEHGHVRCSWRGVHTITWPHRPCRYFMTTRLA